MNKYSLDKNYENTFNDIKEEYWKTEDKSKKFIVQMIDYFNIKDKKVISDLKMIIYIKKYEMIVKSIKYFFDINISEMNMNNLKKL